MRLKRTCQNHWKSQPYPPIMSSKACSNLIIRPITRLFKRKTLRLSKLFNKMAGRRFNRHGKSAVVPQPGMRNIILTTCARGHEARCTAELGQIIDRLFDTEEAVSTVEPESRDTTLSFAKQIEQEVSGLKDRRVRNYHALDAGELKCIVLVQLSEKYDCNLAAARMFPPSDPFAARFCQRVIPIQLIVRAEIADIRTHLPSVIQSPFSQPGQKFAVIYESRLNESLDRSTVIELVADVVGTAHSVDLSAPDLVIMIQVFKNLCGLSVLDQYYARSRYNLQSYYAKVKGN